MYTTFILTFIEAFLCWPLDPSAKRMAARAQHEVSVNRSSYDYEVK